jgi:hypothetical protein
MDVSSEPPKDWPPAGQCYFCERPAAQPPWTCVCHRTLEASAVTLARGFLNRGAERPTDRDDYVTAYSPPVLSEGESNLFFAFMNRTFLDFLVEQVATGGALPSVDSLLLTPEERDGLLQEELAHARADSKRERAKFTLENMGLGDATFRLSRGFRGKQSARFRVTVNELGLIERDAADQTIPALHPFEDVASAAAREPDDGEYRPLTVPIPLQSEEVRFPDIDMDLIVPPEVSLVEEIIEGARDRALSLAAEPLPPQAEDLRQLLATGFQVGADNARAKDILEVWTLRGWAVGSLEEERGVARRGKSERHFAAALNLLRDQLIGELDDEPKEVSSLHDAYYLGLHCAYFLSRNPDATAASLNDDWRSYRAPS